MNQQTQTWNLQESDLKEFEIHLYEKEHARATIKKYLTDVNTFFTFLAGDHRIQKQQLLAYKAWLCQSYASTSVNSMLAAVNRFLDFVGAGSLKVKRLKIQKQIFRSEEREMTKAEYLRLVKAAYQKQKPQLALGMETLATTGARISELSFFTVEQIRTGKIEITNKGKKRTILISESLKKKLLGLAAKHRIKTGSIFITRTGKTKDRSNFWREMKDLKEAAGVAANKIFPHNLRHLFARMFYKATKDLTGLADLLGHSSLDVTRIYTAVSWKTYKKQIERLQYLLQ